MANIIACSVLHSLDCNVPVWQSMAGRHYVRDQDAEEPEDFIVALTSQVLQFLLVTC